jgi:hypothetical protein
MRIPVAAKPQTREQPVLGVGRCLIAFVSYRFAA